MLEELFNLDRPEPIFPDKEKGKHNRLNKGREKYPGCALMDGEIPWGE